MAWCYSATTVGVRAKGS